MNENKFYLQKIDFMKIKLKIKKSLQKTGVFPEAIPQSNANKIY